VLLESIVHLISLNFLTLSSHQHLGNPAVLPTKMMHAFIFPCMLHILIDHQFTRYVWWRVKIMVFHMWFFQPSIKAHLLYKPGCVISCVGNLIQNKSGVCLNFPLAHEYYFVSLRYINFLRASFSHAFSLYFSLRIGPVRTVQVLQSHCWPHFQVPES
jgi:hypothetical protein